MGKGKHNATIRRQAYAAGFEAGVACDNEIWLEALRRTTSLTPEQVQELANNVIQVAHERGDMIYAGPEQPAAKGLGQEAGEGVDVQG